MRNTKLKLLIICLVLLIGLLVGQWVLAADTRQEAQPEPETTEEPSRTVIEDHSGQSCGECHLDYQSAWENSVHAIAYVKESFQAAWAQAGNDPDCLKCHTTGYQPARQTYTAENIQCEECHGSNPPNHPPEPIVVRTSADICGDCHTSTFNEWEHSLHAFTQDMGAIGCATCHEPHSQKIRFDTIDGLCLNCHQNNPQNREGYAETYVHLTHNEVRLEGVDVTCASCHMYKSSSDAIHNLSDHSTQVQTVPCTDCHEAISQAGVSTVLVDVDTALAEERDQLRQRVSELEAALTSQTEAESEGSPDYVELTRGLIVGFGVGLTLFLVIVRRNNRG